MTDSAVSVKGIEVNGKWLEGRMEFEGNQPIVNVVVSHSLLAFPSILTTRSL